MEKLYKKVGRRYVEVGYDIPDISDGFYFTQKTKSGRRTTSVLYWLGKNPKEPVDLDFLADIMQFDDELAKYLTKLCEEDSEEFKELKEGNYINLPLSFYNISPYHLAQCVLRFLYNKGKK